MNSAVVTTLLERRAQLIIRVREAETTIRDLLGDIEHLDAAIAIFHPDHRPVPPRIRYAGHGHVSRTLLTILRKSSEPLTIRDLTTRLLEHLGLEAGNKRQQVRTALSRQKENGVLTCEMGPGQALLWRIMN